MKLLQDLSRFLEFRSAAGGRTGYASAVPRGRKTLGKCQPVFVSLCTIAAYTICWAGEKVSQGGGADGIARLLVSA